MESKYISNGAESLNRKQMRYSYLAFSLASFLLIGGLLFPFLKRLRDERGQSSKIEVKAKKTISYAELTAPPPIELKKPPPELLQQPPKIKKVKFLQPVAKKDEEVPDELEMPTMEEMEKTQISTVDQEGIDSIYYETEKEGDFEIVVEEEVRSFAQVMPEFPGGGERALLEYLRDNTNYPDVARDAQMEGTVVLEFVVEKDGSISNIKILRSVFDVLDNEAIRVVEVMPRWTPGIQNGEKVRVKFILPIRFRLDRW